MSRLPVEPSAWNSVSFPSQMLIGGGAGAEGGGGAEVEAFGTSAFGGGGGAGRSRLEAVVGGDGGPLLKACA